MNSNLPPTIAIFASLAVRDLWRVDYQTAFDAMRRFTDARTPDTGDELWLVEHPPVYTQGIAGKPEHLLHAGKIPVVRTDRGGQITYHGPGQLVVYLLLDLRRRNLGVRQMVRALEAGVCDWLATYQLKAWGKNDAPGVYVPLGDSEAKIASLGLKIRNGCSYHGLSVNIALDLAPFLDINPCGYSGLKVTRLADWIPADRVPDLKSAGLALAPLLAQHLFNP